MKYIKRFNEEVSYTYGNDMVFLKGLEDDIEGIFVQVLDDGWVLDYQLTDYAGNIGWVRLRKESGESKPIDELLPYLHHFYDYIKSKGYDFYHINLFGWICVDYDRSKQAINFARKDWDFIEQHLIAVTGERPVVGSISMNLSHNFTSKDRTRNLNSYNESNSEGLNEVQIKDFCESHLAYLLDDGLKVVVNEDEYFSSIFDVLLSFNRIENRTWGEVKEQVIPFLIRLNRQYELSFFEKDDMYYDLEVDVLFLSGGEVGVYTDYINLDDLVNERIGATIKSDNKVKTIKFIIRNKK